MTNIIRFTLVIILSSLFISGQAQDPGKKMDKKDIKMLIDSISFSLKRYYIYPDKAALIGKTLNDNYKKGAYKNITDSRTIANTLHADIQKTHRDGHMRVMYFPEFEKKLLTVLPDSLIKKEAELELADDRKHNFHFIKTEILPGNIGYLRWDGFAGFTEEARPTYESAFQFVVNTQALIIDMRYNGGGSPQTVNAMLNYFFTKRLPMNHIINHTNDTMKNYTDPAVTKFKLNMPVYILTAKNTFSGAEDFTYAMKVAKRATIVGDTTGGGAHPTGPCTLGQGFVLNIPDARSYHEITKTNWEGVGVWPDIFISSEKALIKSQSLVLTDAYSKTTDDEEKNKLKYNLNGMRPKLMQKDSIKLSTQTLLKYCGDYVPTEDRPNTSQLSIVFSCDKIYRHMDNAFNKDAFLIPIAENKFLYDEDSGKMLEFIVDKNGVVTGLVTQWWTGTTQMIKKK